MSIWYPIPNSKVVIRHNMLQKYKKKQRYTSSLQRAVPLQIRIIQCSYWNHFTLFMVPFMGAVTHHHLLLYLGCKPAVAININGLHFLHLLLALSSSSWKWLPAFFVDAVMKVLNSGDSKNFSSGIRPWHSAATKVVAKDYNHCHFGCFCAFGNSIWLTSLQFLGVLRSVSL